MGKFLRTVVLLCAVLAVCKTAEAGDLFRFSIGLMPGDMMIVPSASGFKASNNSSTLKISETVQGGVLLAPAGFIGLDIDTNNSGVGLDVFAGKIISAGVMGDISGVNVSYILPHKEDGIMRWRVKAGVIKSSLTWQGSLSVKFNNAEGSQVGVGMDLGRRVAFYWEVLYRSLKFDAKAGTGVTLSSKTLDLSGPAVNLGVKFNF